jgi:hypothetical protein
MNAHFQISLSITVLAPFLIAGSEPGTFGLDAVVLRDHNKHPIIPGTLLTGKLRAAWSALGWDDRNIAKWLGKEAADHVGAAGLLVDSDLRLECWDQKSENTTPYPRVSIDPATGAAKPGALQFIEQPWKVGQPLTFAGHWYTIGSKEEVDQLCRAMAAGLEWMGQLGSDASIGFGRIQSVACSASETPTRSVTQPSEKTTRLYFKLTSDSPLMIPELGHAVDNLFRSGDTIPGNVLKASLANTLAAIGAKPFQLVNGSLDVGDDLKPLAVHFQNLKVSHALPAMSHDEKRNETSKQTEENKNDIHKGKRPLPTPQSLVEVGDHVFDVANFAKPQLIDGKPVAFQVDWKGINAVEDKKKCCWPEVSRELRVHTAINSDTGIADEGKLFAYESVVHTPGWLGWFDVSGIESASHEKVKKALRVLCAQPLLYLGKTKAAVTLTLLDAPVEPAWEDQSMQNSQAGTVTLMLNTPALMTRLSEIGGCSTGGPLHASYAAYFSEVSGSALELSHYFAWQSLVGGENMYVRRQKKHGGVYRPYVLTNPGSVFVLTIKNSTEAPAILKCWKDNGLPLSEKVGSEWGTTFQRNPYLPEHGFGEIAINVKHGFSPPKPAQLSEVKPFTELTELTLNVGTPS